MEAKNQSVFRIALAGNPNSGKTTIFNNITGARQHVGNYPGVTVERVEGKRSFENTEYLFVDLPGTYSLTARSLDEVVARNTIINEAPDVLVDVLDTSNLERNLYLAAQMMELERPMVLALNMTDVASEMGITVDHKKLGEAFGATVVSTIGRTNIGTTELLRAVATVAKDQDVPTLKVNYGDEVEPRIETLIKTIHDTGTVTYPVRWLAIKLLEGDEDVISKVKALGQSALIINQAEILREELKSLVDLETVFQEQRHAYAVAAYQGALLSVPKLGQTKSDKIDQILTHRIWGLPIFMGIMWLLFNAVFTIGAYPQDWLDQLMGLLGDWVTTVVPAGQVQSLLVDGIIGGVGQVISFLPWILLLFLGIAFLEDSGYMARAAFVMDRIMRAFGLQGKSFIPMLIGFGCTVASVMGSRILDNPKDRMVTILVSPFMSCSARMPVYIMLIGAFFSTQYAGSVMFGIYVLGIILAIIFAKIFRGTLFKGELEPFVMEMPPYHMPTAKSVLIHMWDRASLYLKKAGTFILGAAILVWFLVSYPQDVTYSQDFDAAREQVSATFEQKDAQILSTLGISSLEDNKDLSDMVGTMQTTFTAGEEAGAEGGDDGVNVYDKLQAEKDGEAVAAEQTPEEKYAEAFNQIKVTNPTLYPVAYQLFTNDLDKQDAIGVLDEDEASEKLSQSYAARFGQFLEPVLKPAGFDWKIGVSLVAAMAAKEVMISTLGTIYAVEASADSATSLQMTLAQDPAFSPLVALSLMVFVLIYPPCIAALSVIGKETSWKWMGFIFVYGNVLAWCASVLVFQVGTMLGF